MLKWKSKMKNFRLCLYLIGIDTDTELYKIREKQITKNFSLTNFKRTSLQLLLVFIQRAVSPTYIYY